MNSSISQIHEKEIISLTCLNLSFSDLGCFNLEFDILKSKIDGELTVFQSLETWDLADISSY